MLECLGKHYSRKKISRLLKARFRSLCNIFMTVSSQAVGLSESFIAGSEPASGVVCGAPEHDAINVTRPHVAPLRALNYISPECPCRTNGFLDLDLHRENRRYLAIIPRIPKDTYYVRTVRTYVRYVCSM